MLDDNVIQHIEIQEIDKDNEISLGRRLIIKNQSYEDLDEVIASFLQPMINFVREIQNFRYYKNIDVIFC